MRDPRTELDKYHGRERKTPPQPYNRKKELQKERELQKRFEEVQAMMAAERGRAPPFEQDI
ncbi:hypothetical protein AAVH_15164 [Aphelenchoides avenae]|nr:hypothetical protein AAVH_15164 [Aphelenchus avenae]